MERKHRGCYDCKSTEQETLRSITGSREEGSVAVCTDDYDRRSRERSALAQKAAAVALLFGLLMSSAGCASILDRFKRFANAGRVAGTVLTEPQRIDASSLETEVFVFTTLGEPPIQRVRFAGDELNKVTSNVLVGSTLVVIDSAPLVDDGEPVLLARIWRASADGNPLRSSFLQRYRAPILAYAFRDDPETLRRLFGDGGPLRQVAVDVETLRATLVDLELLEPPEPVRDERPVVVESELPDPFLADELEQCRQSLIRVDGALMLLGVMAEDFGGDSPMLSLVSEARAAAAGDR